MSVGEDLTVASDNRSENIYRSGKAFAGRTYGDRQGWSGKLIADRPSVDESSFTNHFVCGEYNAVV
jgi:hypothetical protein